MIAVLQQDHAVTEDDAFNVTGKTRQMDGARIRQCTKFFGLSWRQRTAASEFFLNAGRQALKVVSGEAATQDFAVMVTEAVSLIM